MKKLLSYLAVVLLVVSQAALAAGGESEKKRIDVAFVLDTTGSMGGADPGGQTKDLGYSK